MTDKLTPQERLEGAEDYLRQRQEAFARRQGIRPTSREEFLQFYDENAAQIIDSLVSLGATRENAAAMHRRIINLVARLPDGSRCDDNFALLLNDRNAEVRAALTKTSIKLRNGVVIGPTHQPHLDAQLGRVYDDTSIIEIAVPTLSFCNRIAEVFFATAPQGIAEAAQRFSNYAQGGPEPTERNVLQRWGEVIQRYAMEGAPMMLPDFTLPQSLTARKEILDAMEIFMVGHEYGHHVSPQPPLPVPDASHIEEHTADFTGRLVSMVVAKMRGEPYSQFMLAGGGAPLLLGSFEMLNRARRVLLTGDDKMPASPTHPHIMSRLNHLDMFEQLAPVAFPYLSEFNTQTGRFINTRRFVTSILAELWKELKPMFQKAHQRGDRPAPVAPPYLTRFFPLGE